MGNRECKTILIEDPEGKWRQFDTCNRAQIREYRGYLKSAYGRYIDISNAPPDTYEKFGTRRINELIESEIVK